MEKDMAITTIDAEIERERLRQEKETFDQNKKQHKTVHILKIVMGFTALVVLLAVLVWCFYVLTNGEKFHTATVISAAVGFLGDITGLMISVWKIVLNPDFIKELVPVTKK